jgi:hypothetical protein
MKTFLLLAAFVLLSGLAAQCASVSATAAESDKQSAEEVRQLNAAEVAAFLHKDPKAMAGLWSDDFVVTNPLNKFVTKQQVLGMVESGFLVITSYDRQIEYLHVYGETVIVAGSETVVWGGRMPNFGKTNIFALRESG